MSSGEAFEPGTLLGDRFRIVGLLGRGGMGEVYEAEDLELRERVALKVLHSLWRSDEDRLERFRREVHLSRKVTHPNVCRIFDVFKYRATPGGEEFTFVTMELLEGLSLDEHLDRHGRMPLEEAEKLIAQMTAALSAAHGAEVIHRDFKTSNVMLVPVEGGEPRAVVTDFGLARSGDPSDDESSQENSLVGSVHYMAPEQVTGEPVSPASDVFALGVVMFEMVTGTRPFHGRNIVKVLSNRVSETAPSVRRFVPDIDERWEQVIGQCLELDPGDRFATAVEVSEALRGDRDSAASPTPTAWRPRPIHGALFALAMLGLVLLIVFFSRTPPGPSLDTGLFSIFDPTQLTTDPGLEIDPAFSPDGRSLLYASDASGGFEIRMRALASGDPDRAITNDGQENVQPTWSPDGRWIAYYSENRGGIWMISAEGGEPRQLTDFGSHPAFSPDGAKLAFQSQGKNQLSAGSAAALPPSTIWVTTIETGRSEPVTSVGQPAGGHGVPNWSPSGERIAFSTYYGRRSEIWSVQVDGKGLVPVVQEKPASFQPIHTPDGKSLLYSAVAEGERYGLWAVPVSPEQGEATGKPRLLANLGNIGIRQLAISSDGSQLAYTALATRSNLFFQSIHPETAEALGDARPLTTGSARNNRPAISPDGSRIAFDRWQVGKHRDIWILEEGSEELQPLTGNANNETQSSWASDGQRVIYLSEEQDSRNLWAQAPGSPTPELLLHLDEHADNVRLSPDGQLLAYHARASSGAIDVWVAELESGESRQLTQDSRVAGYPSWSPDGRQLAYETRQGEDTHVSVMSAEGDAPTQLTQAPGQSWPYSWSPDGERIAFAGERDGFWNVYWIDVGTGLETKVTHFQRKNLYVRYPAWSPRNDGIVFELAETTGDIFWVQGKE